jgi:hypothetical protein
MLKHDNQLALSRCISNPIELEVYTDGGQSAQGSLAIDDGVTLGNTLSKFNFTYSDGILTVSSTKRYQLSSKTINEVKIYGLPSPPTLVIDPQGNEVAFCWEPEQGRVHVLGFEFDMMGLKEGESATIISLF